MTEQRRTAALAQAIEDLEWFKIPHTIDLVIGIYAEASGEHHGTRARTMTNEEIVASVVSRSEGRGQKGGHSDPTPTAALYGTPDAVDDDMTLGAIDAALDLLTEGTRDLDWACSDALGKERRNPPSGWNGRQSAITDAATRIHHLRPNLEPAMEAPGTDTSWLHGLVLTDIAETASWLRVKAEDIWLASRGETRGVAVQQAIKECACCAPWRSGTMATHGEYCSGCANFKSNHGVYPIEGIVKRWEYGKGATPSLIAEAVAAAKPQPKRKARAS